jgi:hypothetical protein
MNKKVEDKLPKKEAVRKPNKYKKWQAALAQLW